MHSRSTLIAVFAKAPQAGRVKTRLAAAIGAEEAARLHARFVERTIATALESGCGVVELHGTPSRNSLLGAIADRYAIRVRPQAQGDIGRRMHEAFRHGLRIHARVIVIGTDCPALTAPDLRGADRWLRSCDAVLAPAEDGGYPLIGLSRPSPRLFEGIEWSTASVMEATRERLRQLGWRWRELRTLWDVDRPEDLARLRAARLGWPLLVRRRNRSAPVAFGRPVPQASKLALQVGQNRAGIPTPHPGKRDKSP